MDIVQCLEKVRNNSGAIVGYKIAILDRLKSKSTTTLGTVKTVKPDQLKQAIKAGQLICANLRLTADNRLIAADTSATLLKLYANQEWLPSRIFCAILGIHYSALLQNIAYAASDNWLALGFDMYSCDEEYRNLLDYSFYRENEAYAQDFLANGVDAIDTDADDKPLVIAIKVHKDNVLDDNYTKYTQGFMFSIDHFNTVVGEYIDAYLMYSSVLVNFFGRNSVVCTASELRRHKDNLFGYFLELTKARK